MLSRTRKLTTVGLPLRDDLLIRSLVQVIGSRTVDDWMFHDGFEADVALCNPHSSLSGIALRRAEQSAGLTCVSVIHDGEDSLPGTKVLHAPIKSTEFIALLNDVSHSAGRIQQLSSAQANDAHSVANALHELMQAKSPELHAVECGTMTVFIVPASRTLYAAAPLAEADMRSWLGAHPLRIDRMQEASARLVVTDENRRDLDGLLWKIGLEGTDGALLSGLPAGAKFHLKRWPDFGRLTHQAFHFRMAALLSRGVYTIEELAAASKHVADDVLAFVNACAMCDLIRIDAVVVEPPRAAPPPQRRYSSILHSIRSALGLHV
jgi:hypothetical protein